MQTRIDKLISDFGGYSRSEARELIRQGRVSVEGRIADRPDEKAEPGTELVIDGRTVPTGTFCLAMNKPLGCVCSADEREGTGVLTLLKKPYSDMELFTVGRLDKDTEGLLLITNDGELCHRVISPKSGIVKRYRATVSGELTERARERLARGIKLADGTRCLPARLTILSSGEQSECLLEVQEGKYHQVRRMLAAAGTPVETLRREAIGGLELPQNIEHGMYYLLKKEELELVFSGGEPFSGHN